MGRRKPVSSTNTANPEPRVDSKDRNASGFRTTHVASSSHRPRSIVDLLTPLTPSIYSLSSIVHRSPLVCPRYHAFYLSSLSSFTFLPFPNRLLSRRRHQLFRNQSSFCHSSSSLRHRHCGQHLRRGLSPVHAWLSQSVGSSSSLLSGGAPSGSLVMDSGRVSHGNDGTSWKDLECAPKALFLGVGSGVGRLTDEVEVMTDTAEFWPRFPRIFLVFSLLICCLTLFMCFPRVFSHSDSSDMFFCIAFVSSWFFLSPRASSDSLYSWVVRMRLYMAGYIRDKFHS